MSTNNVPVSSVSQGNNLKIEMAEAFAQLEHEPLRNVLLESVESESESVNVIKESFEHFTEDEHNTDMRRNFFASWQRTNNSAMSVEGLANRITAEGEVAAANQEGDRALSLFRAAGRLNRVTDEDLGVQGQVLHFELYYRMATAFCGRDDLWQSRRYCKPAAAGFKTWLDAARLRESVMTGLFSMLIHEGYTHAELETVAPSFDRWATEIMKVPKSEARRNLAWIAVHNGGTEKAHFVHSCAALNHYCAGAGTNIDLDAASQVFRSYLRRKAAAMRELIVAH